MTIVPVFRRCVEAIRANALITRESSTDKEFHFQNWFRDRLAETPFHFDAPGRNLYPDFRLVRTPEGYEVKGLAYPGRDATFDSNSQVPSGFHNGRTVYYVFGRYPKKPDGNTYPVLDLVVCHGDFLNADHEYVHENKSVKGFGSDGDLMIRDRKMYVVPTPFRLLEGVAHHQTLILPADTVVGDGMICVGDIRREEAANLIIGYSFNLQTNELEPETIPNPSAGREHLFKAWRLEGSPQTRVSLRRIDPESVGEDINGDTEGAHSEFDDAAEAEETAIESDSFPAEFLSRLAKQESWRKEIHRPIYHVHKWWAKRLGSVFRGILLGSALPAGSDLPREFYRGHSFTGLTVFDPFMGSGTTVGEAHKLGFTAFGRDINPVAVDAVRVALGAIDRRALRRAFDDLSDTVGTKIRSLYRSNDSQGRFADVLYFFWVMRVTCISCQGAVDLFPSWVIARNAYPDRKPEIQVLCPACQHVFPSLANRHEEECPSCRHRFTADKAPAKSARATCQACGQTFKILDAIDPAAGPPSFRLFAKLVLTPDERKEYLPATPDDVAEYDRCAKLLADELIEHRIRVPSLRLACGHNTRQAMSYGFTEWRHFFNARQLLALGWLQQALLAIPESTTRDALLILFSGTLEFNNMFASYKGEGTGAVRHMFAHHVLKPERTPIEANVWGTSKSSGAFASLYRTRLLRALRYRAAPTEIDHTGTRSVVCSPPFSGRVMSWPTDGGISDRAIYLSQGDSSNTGLPGCRIDFVVTDPPFFDNVHYSELADFFYSWQQLSGDQSERSTRDAAEVQDADVTRFERKLRSVFRECHRVLRDNGLFVFTYHHSRDEGWTALAEAIVRSGFVVVNSHPLKSEMSVATPKSQAKEPIQIDIVIVCRKSDSYRGLPSEIDEAIVAARAKLSRLRDAGFRLSSNDQKVVYFGQLLTTIRSLADVAELPRAFDRALREEEQAQLPARIKAPDGDRFGAAQGRLL